MPCLFAGFEDPAAIIQLVGDGQMVVHDLEYGGAALFALPFQSQPAAIVCAAAAVAPALRPAGLPPSCLCVAHMRKVKKRCEHRCGDMTGSGRCTHAN